MRSLGAFNKIMCAVWLGHPLQYNCHVVITPFASSIPVLTEGGGHYGGLNILSATPFHLSPSDPFTT